MLETSALCQDERRGEIGKMSLQQIPLSPSYAWVGTGKHPPALGIRHGKSGAVDSGASKPDHSRNAACPIPASKEDALVRRAVAGDAEALEQLFSVNTDKLRQIAFAVLRNKEDAEDALQNAFLSACRNLATFKGQSTFSTWLTSIVINSARMARRRNNSRSESSLDEILVSCPERLEREIADTRENPEQACAETELRALIEERIERLPRRLQTAFRVHTFAGVPLAEASAVLGVQLGTLKARIFRARQHITKSLRQELRIRAPKSAGRSGNRCATREPTNRARLAYNAGESATADVQESLGDKVKARF